MKLRLEVVLAILSTLAYTAEFANGQDLQVTSLPSVLFHSNGGLHNVVEGSVIQLYCSVESTTATFSWNKDRNPVVIDVPHLRERTTNDSTTTTSVLTVDNFQSSDTGTYQCFAKDGMSTGNGQTVNLIAWRSTGDGGLSIVAEPADNEMMFESLNQPNQRLFTDNRTGVILGSTIGSNLLSCQVTRSGSVVFLPTVSWIINGRMISTSSGFTSSLNITNFTASDAGVYQCIFTDTDGTAEVVTSVPLRLDTDIISYSALFQFRVNTIFLENISPLVIFIRPPEKLVIEVTCRGRYSGISWERTFSSATIDPSSLSNHDEIYTIGRTTEADFGFYEVFPLTSPPTFQELVPISMLDFIVTTIVAASTRANHGQMLSVMEGGSLNISCTSTGAPTPTVIWILNGQLAPFSITEVTSLPQAQLVGTSDGGLRPNVTLGRITSDIMIINAQYTADDGNYTCAGSNDNFESNSSAHIYVQVLVAPTVEVLESRTRINIGASTTLTCHVNRTNPDIVNYTWMNEDTSTVLNGNTNTLLLMLSTTQDFGTISCNATNAAGISGKANVTIEQGFPPQITTVQPDPVFFNTPVQLVCVVIGGDPPRNITWTSSNGTQVYFTNSTAGANISLSITRYDYGEYVCTASNEFGETDGSIQVRHPDCFNETFGINCSERCFCMNGGTCDSAIGCICVDDWTGTNCSIGMEEDKTYTETSMYIPTVGVERDSSQTREAITWSLVCLLTLLFIGLLSTSLVIVVCKHLKKQRGNNEAQALTYEMTGNPSYETSTKTRENDVCEAVT